MAKSILSWSNSDPSARLELSLRLRQMLSRARLHPDDFVEFGFTDGMGRPLRQGQVHRDLQAFLGQHPQALVELPRDHGKSLQVCLRVLWELGHRPALRVKIVCASEALAAERGRFLRDAIAHNQRLRLVFPALRPAHPWEATRFTIDRPASVIGPSVAAIGVGAASTGARADLLVCDDVVDVRALASRAERERIRTAFHENLLNLLEPDGRVWNLFTPWHRDDLNARLIRNATFAHFRRAVGANLEPVWPEQWPREALAERRAAVGALAFARGYRLVTLAESDALIRPDWLRYWHEPAPDYERVVLAIDPALSEKQSADASALVALARTPDNEIRCLEALAVRVAMPDLVARIAAADARHRPDVILFESNAAFEAVRALLVRRASFGPKIKGIVQTRDKAARVRAFSVMVENGTFRLHGDGTQQALADEMVSFPHGEHDDLLDAAAFGTAELLDSPEPRVW